MNIIRGNKADILKYIKILGLSADMVTSLATFCKDNHIYNTWNMAEVDGVKYVITFNQKKQQRYTLMFR